MQNYVQNIQKRPLEKEKKKKDNENRCQGAFNLIVGVRNLSVVNMV